jgi:hypothetical protein
VLAKDENNVYAWGQGQILEDKSFHDVICNQPVTLEPELVNEMKFDLPKSEHRDSIMESFNSQGTILRSRDSDTEFVETPVVTPQRRELKQPSRVPMLALHDLPNRDSLSPSKQCSSDLETVKNSDDYHHFIQNKEDNEP